MSNASLSKTALKELNRLCVELERAQGYRCSYSMAVLFLVKKLREGSQVVIRGK